MKRRPSSLPIPAIAPRSGPDAVPPLEPIAWRRLGEPFLIPLLLLLGTRGFMGATIPFAAEDAYITFRYARNLALGNGLLYNPGEWVMGFSSPLWTVWCALGIRLLGDPVLWARTWLVAADALTLVLITRLLRQHVGRASAWCFACFFASWPFFAAVAVSGMETGLMLTLIVASAVLARRGSALTGPALAALVFVRPEGLVAAAVVVIGARMRDRLIALALAALGMVALWRTYGSPLPQSALAKAMIYGHPGPLQSRVWWDWLIPFPIGAAPQVPEGVHLFLLSVLIAPAVVLGAIEVWRLRRTALGLAVAASLVVWLGYAAVGVAYFFWYLVVPLGGFLILAAAGLPRLVRGPAVYVSAGLYLIGIWTIAFQVYVGRAKLEAGTFGAVADYLASNARPGEKVFLEPIGLIGYRNPLVVVDEVGLISPAVARRRIQGPGWYTDVVNQERPDWLVVRASLLARGAGFAGRWEPLRSPAERDSLNAHYAIASRFPPDGGEGALLVLRRNR